VEVVTNWLCSGKDEYVPSFVDKVVDAMNDGC
jgi:hypothetical protein